MTHEFTPYELAVKLKAIEFDEPCFAFYQREYAEVTPTMVDDNEQYRLTGFRTCKNSEIPEHYISAPTFSQAFRWFREKGYRYTISFDSFMKNGMFYFEIWENGKCWFETDFDYNTYEEAELACLTELIEIVEGQKDSK